MVGEASSESPVIQSATTAVAQSDRQAAGDAELIAMNDVVKALSPLTEDQRLRAIEYVLRRFNVPLGQSGPPTVPAQMQGVSLPPLKRNEAQTQIPVTGAIQDIRTLKEAKLPKSANEMAALVGYYMSELAPEGDRKKEIGKADVERHFKAAGFKLPADAGFTLVNAKNAGYLDSAGVGQYKLNPVGYNLVVHRMGNRDDKSKKSERGRRPRAKGAQRQSKKAPRVKK
jgi:hypothetical protein